MIIIGADYHPGFQQIAFVDTDTGELQERRLEHREDAEKFYRDLAAQELKVRVGMEASGHARWFERLLGELQFELWIGDAAEIRTKRVRKQETDRQDAQLILKLMLKDDFPQIWVPNRENRDLRQLLWHRHRMVQARTRIIFSIMEIFGLILNMREVICANAVANGADNAANKARGSRPRRGNRAGPSRAKNIRCRDTFTQTQSAAQSRSGSPALCAGRRAWSSADRNDSPYPGPLPVTRRIKLSRSPSTPRIGAQQPGHGPIYCCFKAQWADRPSVKRHVRPSHRSPAALTGDEQRCAESPGRQSCIKSAKWGAERTKR
jgi:hypothetical protein